MFFLSHNDLLGVASIIIISTCLVSRVVVWGFSSTSAPTFHVFANSLVGQTWYNMENASDTRLVEIDTQSGAIKGVADGKHYLDLDQDGFVYFDDGSYSYGPTHYQRDENMEWIFSIMVAPGVRLLADFGQFVNPPHRVGSFGAEIWTTRPTVTRTTFRRGVRSSRAPPKVQWSWQQQCHAPSQPWNRDRLEWKSDSLSSSRGLQVPGEGGGERYTARVYFPEGSTDLFCVVSGSTTGFVKMLTRHYEAGSGALESVGLQHGCLSIEDALLLQDKPHKL